MKNSDRIPANQSQAYSRWELPEVNEGQIIQAEKTRRDVARGQAPNIDKNLVVYNKLTVAQIEEISLRIQEDVQKEAYNIGLKQGHQKGYKAGLQKGQNQIQQHLDHLQAIISHLNDALQFQDAEVERSLVKLAMDVAQSVLHRELTIDSSHITEVIQQAVAAIDSNAKKIDLYLNPQDLKFVTEMGQVQPNWKLHVDSSLSPGGCRVANQYSVAELLSEAQFQQTVDQLVDERFAKLNRQVKQLSAVIDKDDGDNSIEES